MNQRNRRVLEQIRRTETNTKAATQINPCPPCDGKGYTGEAFSLRVCLACGGIGRTK